MQARQITTYAVHSRAITEETVLPVTLEADEPRHLESGVINLYPDIRYQEIEGFGGALTDTVGYLYSKMTPECKRQLLEAYFGENGQHYRFLRMHIDSCDYSLDEYQAGPQIYAAHAEGRHGHDHAALFCAAQSLVTAQAVENPACPAPE